MPLILFVFKISVCKRLQQVSVQHLLHQTFNITFLIRQQLKIAINLSIHTYIQGVSFLYAFVIELNFQTISCELIKNYKFLYIILIQKTTFKWFNKDLSHSEFIRLVSFRHTPTGTSCTYFDLFCDGFTTFFGSIYKYDCPNK